MCTPPRGLRGWGCPRRAAGPSVPLSADTVFPPPGSVAVGGGGPACGEERRGDLSSRRGPGPPWLASPPSRASSRRKRPLGGVGPWGVGGVGDGLVPRGGGEGPAGVVWGCVGSCLRSAVVHRPALGGRCFPAPGRPRRPPCLCGAFLPRRASAVRARSPPTPRGSRPVGTGGSRPRPSPWVRPRPGDACPGGDPRDAAASARRCALSPRAVAVPRFEPPLREGAACGGGGGGRG